MISTRFLAPVLAIVAFGLPASAAIVEYCSGSGCGASNNSQFLSDLSTDAYTLQGLTTFSAMAPALTYTDSTTGIEFEDFPGLSNLTVSGGVLSTASGDDSIVIVIPAAFLAISLDVDVTRGLCANDCVENETTGFVGFINTGSPSSPWTITISPLGTPGFVEIADFNAAISGTPAGPGPGDPEVPEVATFVLIGSGLIAMRWMRRLPRRFFRTPQPA